MTAVHPDIPLTLATLAHLPRWVPWQTMRRDGPDSPVTKVPFNPHSSGKARADDPATWGTREAAEAHAARLPKPFGMGGVGIEFGGLADRRCIGGVDLDTCREADGTLAPWAAEVVARLDSYTECSPSGTGVKVFFEYSPAALPMLRATMGTVHGKQFKRGGGDHPPAIELHVSNRYFAVTDEHLPGTPIELRLVTLPTLLWLVCEAGPAFVGNGHAHTKRNGHDGSRSAIAFRKGIALRRDGFSFDAMCAALAADPETAEWVVGKGYADKARELHRIWNAGAVPPPSAELSGRRSIPALRRPTHCRRLTCPCAMCSPPLGQRGSSGRRRRRVRQPDTSPRRCYPSPVALSATRAGCSRGKIGPNRLSSMLPWSGRPLPGSLRRLMPWWSRP